MTNSRPRAKCSLSQRQSIRESIADPQFAHIPRATRALPASRDAHPPTPLSEPRPVELLRGAVHESESEARREETTCPMRGPSQATAVSSQTTTLRTSPGQMQSPTTTEVA